MEKISELRTRRKLWTGYHYLTRKKYAFRAVACFTLFCLILFSYFLISRFWPSSSEVKMAEKRQITRVEMAFSLPESGIQAIWIFDRLFNLEGVQNEN